MPIPGLSVKYFEKAHG